MFSRNSVKLPAPLYEQALAETRKAGYSSIEEFVAHAVEKELARLHASDSDKAAVIQQLKGLGYLE